MPVTQEEGVLIEAKANAASKSIAAYLREIGLGYEVRGTLDYERVEELAKVSADLGRLGGLLKMWLTNEERLLRFSSEQVDKTILVALERINGNQEEIRNVIENVMKQRQ